MDDTTPNMWINALIGAVVTIVLSFTMVSPVLGGIAAGYLQRENGARIGALSGIFASIPIVLFGFAAITFLVFAAAQAIFGFLVFVFLAVLVPVYIIGLGALGGYLGVYLHAEL